MNDDPEHLTHDPTDAILSPPLLKPTAQTPSRDPPTISIIARTTARSAKPSLPLLLLPPRQLRRSLPHRAFHPLLILSPHDFFLLLLLLQPVILLLPLRLPLLLERQLVGVYLLLLLLLLELRLLVLGLMLM